MVNAMCQMDRKHSPGDALACGRCRVEKRLHIVAGDVRIARHATGDGVMADDDQKGSALRKVVGLGLIVMLILGALFVVEQLRHAAAIQDCLASGRTNCAPIASGR